MPYFPLVIAYARSTALYFDYTKQNTQKTTYFNNLSRACNDEREVSKGFGRYRSRAVTNASVTRNLHYMQTCIFRIASPLPQKKNGGPVLFLWQGRRDSNTQPMVLETTTLPLSHSPKLPIYFTMRTIKSQMILSVFLKIDPPSSNCSNNAQNSRVSQRNIV